MRSLFFNKPNNNLFLYSYILINWSQQKKKIKIKNKITFTNRIVSFESKSARTLVEQRIARRCPSLTIRTANYLLLQQPEHQQHQHQQQLQQQHQQHAKQQQKPDDIGDHSGVLDDRYEPVSFCSNITATQKKKKNKNRKSENITTKICLEYKKEGV